MSPPGNGRFNEAAGETRRLFSSRAACGFAASRCRAADNSLRGECCAFIAPMEKRFASRNGGQTLTETGDNLLTLRILRPLRLGVCGEFSDYSLEDFGWPSGRTRLDCRPDALCQHPDFKRYGLDQSNETLGRARPQTGYLRGFVGTARR